MRPAEEGQKKERSKRFEREKNRMSDFQWVQLLMKSRNTVLVWVQMDFKDNFPSRATLSSSVYHQHGASGCCFLPCLMGKTSIEHFSANMTNSCIIMKLPFCVALNNHHILGLAHRCYHPLCTNVSNGWFTFSVQEAQKFFFSLYFQSSCMHRKG